eukprot:SAG31_NODE_28_length_32713_cov_39.100509_18_plen_55_part_00
MTLEPSFTVPHYGITTRHQYTQNGTHLAKKYRGGGPYPPFGEYRGTTTTSYYYY